MTIIIRLIAAIILSTALALGVGWAMSYLAQTQGSEAPPAPAEGPEYVEGEGEPPLPLPYEDGDAAAWLARTLTDMGETGLAELAARAAAPQPAPPAEPRVGDVHVTHEVDCGSSHTAVHCNIYTVTTTWTEGGVDERRDREHVTMQNREGGWVRL